MPSELKLVTTGKAADLLGVTSDTVLRWIKQGRLVARRTRGGHHRILLKDLEPLLQDGPNQVAPKVPSTGAPGCAHCWDYLSPHGEVRPECSRCIVFRSRASWCFELAEFNNDIAVSGIHCVTTCEECAYYRRVKGLPTKVLIISSDQELIRTLEEAPRPGVALRFARNTYEASSMIGIFLPGIVVLDCEMGPAVSTDLVHCIASDTRVPGLRIVLAVRSGAGAPRISARGKNLLAGVLEKPFDARCIKALIDCLPAVELIEFPEDKQAELQWRPENDAPAESED